MKFPKQLELNTQAGMLDVQALDVLAQLESLLRDVREIQRQLLRLRGVPEPASVSERRAARSAVCKRTRRMLNNSDAISKVLRELLQACEVLPDVPAES